MMTKPTINELLNKIDNRYRLVIAVSRRARQIADGSVVLTSVKEESPVTLAAYEVVESKLILIEEENN